MKHPLDIVLLTALCAAARGAEELRPHLSTATITHTAREMIEPRDVQPEIGRCYLARVRNAGPGDCQGNRARTTLLEDGRPLPHPKSLHKHIRQKGRGRYSHWRHHRLYFSASDSSDPRTNGRSYELVSRQTLRVRRATVRARADSSTFTLANPADARLTPVRLVLRNLDPAVAVVPHLRLKGWPDLTSVGGMLHSILRNGMTDEQKAVAIWAFIRDWRYHYYPAEGGDECHDPVKFINVYGYGFCDDSAANFAVLCRAAGLRARCYGLSGHVVAEAHYDKAWHMFDPDHQVFYRRKDGVIAGVDHLARHPELITAKPKSPIGYDSRKLAELYTTTQNNRPYRRRIGRPHRLRPRLGPGDEVVFDVRWPLRAHCPRFHEQPLPPVLGNGRRVRRVDLPRTARGGAVLLRETWPYLVLGAELAGTLRQDGAPLRAAVSVDGRHWAPCRMARRGPRFTANADRAFSDHPTAAYAYTLKLETPGADPAGALTAATLTTRFQFAPKALPHVRPGKTAFELTLDFPGRPKPPDKWEGVSVVLEWTAEKGSVRRDTSARNSTHSHTAPPGAGASSGTSRTTR